MICQTLFTLSASIAAQIALSDARVIEITVDKDMLMEARHYINTKVPGHASFIKDGKLFVVRYGEEE